MKKKLFTLGFAGILMVTGILVTSYSAPVYAQTGAVSNSGGIQNPIKATSIQCFIKDAVDVVLDILSVAAVLYIIWAGFLFVKAQGNEKELEDAKKALLNALIGTAIILGAWVFASTIANTISKITNQNVALSQSCS